MRTPPPYWRENFLKAIKKAYKRGHISRNDYYELRKEVQMLDEMIKVDKSFWFGFVVGWTVCFLSGLLYLINR